MKNKKTSYFMLPVVLVIWAVIGWKVYAMMKKDDIAHAPAQEPAANKTKDGDIPDTFKLLANYRDPFLDEVAVKVTGTNQHVKINLPVKKDTASKRQLVFPKLAYFGLVRRSGDEKAVGFLNVNGQSHFVKGGEQLDEIVVGRIWKDSVEVMMGKEQRIVRK